MTTVIQKNYNQATEAVQQAANYLWNLLRGIFNSLRNAGTSSYTWMTGIVSTITQRPSKTAIKKDIITEQKEPNQKVQDPSVNETQSYLPTFSITQNKLYSRANLYWVALAVATTYLAARSLVSYGSSTVTKPTDHLPFFKNTAALNTAPEHAPTPAPDFETGITDSHKGRFFDTLSLDSDKMSQVPSSLMAAGCTFWVAATMAKLRLHR